MMIVVGIKELAGLVAMHRNVGAVKIQHDFFWWGLVLLNKVVSEQFMSFNNGLPVHSLLHPAQG
jgi:hypothetical protein